MWAREVRMAYVFDCKLQGCFPCATRLQSAIHIQICFQNHSLSSKVWSLVFKDKLSFLKFKDLVVWLHVLFHKGHESENNYSLERHKKLDGLPLEGQLHSIHREIVTQVSGTSLSLAGSSGPLTWVRAVLSMPINVCSIFVCQTMVWLPVFGIFNMHTDVDAYDCIQELYRRNMRVCTGSWLWEKNP